jgi:hypothetical protein
LSTSASTTAAKGGETRAILSLAGQHKLITLGIAAVLAFMVAMFVVAAVGGKAGAVSDSTTCTQWGSANQDQQAAYGRLYIREHGPISGARRSPASVITAINNECALAYGDDVSDTTTVLQAIKGDF